MDEGSKRCSRCRVTKPLTEYYRDKRKPDGLYGNCKPCHRVLTDAWKARNRAAVVQHRAKTRAKNREVYNERAAEYRRRDVEAERARQRRYKNANRAAATALEAIRRGRRAGAAGHATPAQIAARVAYYGGKCWMCGAPWSAIDHVKPLAAGGSNWPANLRPACQSCNSAKGARWPFRLAA